MQSNFVQIDTYILGLSAMSFKRSGTIIIVPVSVTWKAYFKKGSSNFLIRS